MATKEDVKRVMAALERKQRYQIWMEGVNYQVYDSYVGKPIGPRFNTREQAERHVEKMMKNG